MTNTIIAQFFSWYFLVFPQVILENGRDFMTWCWRFFSIGFFARRLFSPWHKDITSYGRGFDLQVWFKAMMWNFISRFLGAFLRIVLIATGLALEVVIFAVTLFCFAFWFAIPGIVIYFLGSSLR